MNKICIAASAGGHLTEALQLKEIWKDKDHFFVSDKRINAITLSKKEKVYFIMPARRNLFKFTVSFFQSLYIILKENPKVIISTGAEIGFPPLLIGFILRKKLIYIETVSRIQPSLTGKLAHYFVKNFYVQWPQSKKFFPKAKYIGSVFE